MNKNQFCPMCKSIIKKISLEDYNNDNYYSDIIECENCSYLANEETHLKIIKNFIRKKDIIKKI